ncbi:hypothetical protein KEM52_005590 [Ascosphaera acerosa]|nr:hypothetical protein KEM52_005590 [Ascosphaera acerosa]
MGSTAMSIARAAALLYLASTVLAHGDDMAMEESNLSMSMPTRADPLTLFPTVSALLTIRDSQSARPGVMLSIARSKHTLAVQFLFLVFNAFGVLLSVAYRASTPDLYPHNAHHKIGWIATWTVSVEVIISFLFLLSGRSGNAGGKLSTTPRAGHARSRSERTAFLPVPTTPTTPSTGSAPHGWAHAPAGSAAMAMSVPDTPTSSHHSRDSDDDCHADDYEDNEEKLLGDGEDGASDGGRLVRMLRLSRLDGFLSAKVSRFMTRRVMRVLEVVYIVIERTILPLGFICIASGAVTYGGIFRGNHIFNGLAHFIKGGIFFWYGVLTTGRWIGCFADFGWAWNVKPSRALVGKWRARVPSGEFTESFVIWLYGVTNVFLEHLAGWGGAWNPEDFEHVSISLLFFGGGLCGMLVESRRVRRWMNEGVFHSAPAFLQQTREFEAEAFEPPQSQRVSLNPIPALIILMLGLMMSSHHQRDMLSTMVHTQWGMLLAGFAVARIFTYIVLCLSPPKSLLPYRPPTEIIASFCLMGGGLVFMLSTRDVVDAMNAYGLHPMFVFTVAMSVTAFTMAWVIVCISVKAWAQKKTPLPMRGVGEAQQRYQAA